MPLRQTRKHGQRTAAKQSALIDVYVTFANQREADRIVRAVVDQRLAACANVWPIRSRYWWKGKVVQAREVAALFKTTAGRFPALERRIRQLHRYQVPCIVAWPIARAFGTYQQWVKKSVHAAT
ncbi:MAG: divalent-cation tolerance protein CutA [Candidatus Kerfeldbacteria bacterium]|nr:divalent-cation tolerance protein CutA [Candidatus Kerfeldbacteria bacterium]